LLEPQIGVRRLISALQGADENDDLGASKENWH